MRGIPQAGSPVPTASATGVATAPGRTDAAGFRRVERVRIVIYQGHAIAEVTGVLHRYPRTLRVPLGLAARLVAAGAPLRVERVGGEHASIGEQR